MTTARYKQMEKERKLKELELLKLQCEKTLLQAKLTGAIATTDEETNKMIAAQQTMLTHMTSIQKMIDTQIENDRKETQSNIHWLMPTIEAIRGTKYSDAEKVIAIQFLNGKADEIEHYFDTISEMIKNKDDSLAGSYSNITNMLLYQLVSGAERYLLEKLPGFKIPQSYRDYEMSTLTTVNSEKNDAIEQQTCDLRKNADDFARLFTNAKPVAREPIKITSPGIGTP